MTYEIHTYGNGEIIHGVLNAVATCVNGGSSSLWEPLKRLGLLLGIFWGAIYALYGEAIKIMTHWIMPMTLIMNILFIPKATVWIHDPVTHYHQKVDNVPYGLAAVAGYVSIIGHAMTVQVEKVFTLPDDLKYHRSGSLFASNLIQKAKTFRVTNADMAENIRGFVEQCVVYDAMLGRKYTLDELRNSTDIWHLVSTNASPARSFMWRENSSTRDSSSEEANGIVTCQEGAARLNRMWGAEETRAWNIYGRQIFGADTVGHPTSGRSPASAELLRYLPLAYETLTNISKSASDILKQNMMIYAVVDAVDGKSAELGNAPNFAARRAYLQQRSTYETLGAMAGEMLPTMKAVLEAIAYACFLFVIPMSLLPFGWTFILRWGQILLWLQMWAPLSAVLNYIMTIAARNKSLSALGGNHEVAIGNVTALCDANADMAAMTGYLAMSLPFLSIALVKGVGSFVHMATHLGNVSQNAAGTAAGEVTSGNLSYGNIHEGNVQIANTGMLQQSRAARLSSGSSTFDDGSTSTTYAASGDVISQVAVSNLPVSVNVAESQSQQLSEAASYHSQTGYQLAESSASHLSSSYRHMAELSQSLSHDQNMQHALNQGLSAEQAQSIKDSVSIVESYAKERGIHTDKAAELFAETSAGLNLGWFSGRAGGKAYASASDREQLLDAQKYAEEHAFDETTRQAVNASRTMAESSSDSETKRLAEQVSGSWDRGITERQEASKNFSEAESYNKQAQYVSTNSATINRNASQELVDFVASSPSDSLIHSSSSGTRGDETTRNHEVVGHRAAVHLLSRDDAVSRAYVERFMEHKNNIQPKANIQQTRQILPETYQTEQKHARYQTTTQDLQDVAKHGQQSITSLQQQKPVSSPSMQQAEKLLSPQDGLPLRSQQEHIKQEGQAIQQQVKEKQSKSVTERAFGKVADETAQLINPKEQSPDSKRLKGEPQQK